MITYFVTQAHRYTMDTYLDTWGAPLRSRIQVRTYRDLASLEWLPSGACIFSDLERLSPAQARLAAEVWSQLEEAGPAMRLLNHPERGLRRADLLRRLHAAGRNAFDVHPAASPSGAVRFPVFVRCANDHEGSRTDVLFSQADVDENIRTAMCSGFDPRELLIVEYCNASDRDGIHHKFSAFRVADRVIPRHLIFSRQWMLKYPDLIDDDKLARERAYLEGNPHAAEIGNAFDLASLDYGRCDYAVIDGRIQVWEINTNPIVMMPPEQYQAVHLPAQEHFAANIRSAFEALDPQPNPNLRIPVRIDPALFKRILSASSA